MQNISGSSYAFEAADQTWSPQHAPAWTCRPTISFAIHPDTVYLSYIDLMLPNMSELIFHHRICQLIFHGSLRHGSTHCATMYVLQAQVQFLPTGRTSYCVTALRPAALM